MKSTIPYFFSYNKINFIYVILVSTILLSSTAAPSTPSCGIYGTPPCHFLPAPPGQTPSCARPGKTYCEHIENYPTYLIKHLVNKWGYQAKHLLVDETWDDFAAIAWQDTPVFYDPSYIFPPQNNDRNTHDKEINGYNYDTPQYDNRNGNGNTNYNYGPYHVPKSSATEGSTYLLYTSSSSQRFDSNKNQVSTVGRSTIQTSSNNSTLWLKRYVRDLSKTSATSQRRTPHLLIYTTDGIREESLTNSSSAHDVPVNTDLWDIVGMDKGTRSRGKRQSPGRSTLCQSTSQFIAPQAALNSKGNWMFVVNQANTARQTVKAELCASNTCNNLCQLPNGYNSRCEQKFVQKRLIALQGNGQNLYTDTFWFPSCCVCTISVN